MYNLNAIISVGYRVNSERTTKFRIWATNILRQFAIKGYVIDKTRLENGTFLFEYYFNILLYKPFINLIFLTYFVTKVVLNFKFKPKRSCLQEPNGWYFISLSSKLFKVIVVANCLLKNQFWIDRLSISLEGIL